MNTLDIPTFGQWMRALREAKGWTIIQCAEKANIKWQTWQRLENDEPKRQNGTPSRPTRATVLKIASTLETPSSQALQAAGHRESYWDVHNHGNALDFMAIYKGLDLADQDDLLLFAIIKWKRKYPDIAPPEQPVMPVPMADQPGEFLCLDLCSGQMSFASGIQPGADILDHQQQLLDILVQLLTWQNDPAGNAEEIVQDLRQVQQVMEK